MIRGLRGYRDYAQCRRCVWSLWRKNEYGVTYPHFCSLHCLPLPKALAKCNGAVE